MVSRADGTRIPIFARQEAGTARDIEAIEQATTRQSSPTRKTILGQEFERVTAIIQSPESNLDDVWDNASARERRVMVEELIEAVTIHADRLEVTVTGAPPLIVRLDEVGLRNPGTGPVVSKGDLNSGSPPDAERRVLPVVPVQGRFPAQDGVVSCCSVSGSFDSFADKLLTNLLTSGGADKRAGPEGAPATSLRSE